MPVKLILITCVGTGAGVDVGGTFVGSIVGAITVVGVTYVVGEITSIGTI